MSGSQREHATLVASAVAVLFVPGDRPDRYAKAMASGADCVVVDLEDAVADGSKPAALAAVVRAMTADSAFRPLVRITSPGSATHDEEVAALAALARIDRSPIGVMLPKAESEEDVAVTASALGGGIPVVPLVESAVGLLNVAAIARVPGVVRLGFGAVDFALDVAADDGDERMLAHAGAAIVVASRAAGLAAPLDSPSLDIADSDAVHLSARRGRGLGFGGKLCIHPSQIAAVRSAYRPAQEDIAWAIEVVGAGSGANRVGGKMVDAPVLNRARWILRAAER